MKRVITGRTPDSFFGFFEAISAIPRESYHEEKIADYLEAFAKERGLFVRRDAANNVFIRKPATPGLEQNAPILLQSHTDMVCEKNAGVVHDFRKDGLELVVEGDILHANGTTLGADDGIGVAAMLAALDGALSRHPLLECLFTSSEEVGLGGVCSFDFSLVSARRMLNLDNAELGLVTSGSCGGVRTDLTLPCKRETTLKPTLTLSLCGLAGGHSGENIHEARANAICLMGRLLTSLRELPGFCIASIDCNGKTNAIPRECRAVVGFDDPEAAFPIVETTAETLLKGLSALDKNANLSVETSDDSFCLSKEDTDRVLAVFEHVQNGVLAMSEEIEGLVEWSRNLGIITTEDDKIGFYYSTRSGKESQLDRAEVEMNALAKELGAAVKNHNRYPGWEYAPVSGVREQYLRAYRRALGKEAVVNVIHAGLECGEIFARVPGMDMISISPTLRDIHSPAEVLDLASAEDFWKTLEAFFAEE